MSVSGLPQDPAGWEDRDREFRRARLVRNEKRKAWHDAGGRWPVGSGPSHPKEWAHVVAADRAYDELSRNASPPSPGDLLKGLTEGDSTAIESAVTWLEADPFALHTGYLKQKIMGRLCRAEMSSMQQERLRNVLLRVTSRGPRHEFRDACKLARHVDSTEFRRSLLDLSARPEPHISYAAARMLAACETRGTRRRTG
jgi:hypothetical protein